MTSPLFYIWYLVSGIWYLVSGIWYLVSGIWYLVSGIWYLVSGIWYLVSGIWYLVSGIWYLVSGMRYPGIQVSRYPGIQVSRYPGIQVSGIQVSRYPVSGIRYPVCNALLSPRCQLRSVHTFSANQKFRVGYLITDFDSCTKCDERITCSACAGVSFS